LVVSLRNADLIKFSQISPCGTHGLLAILQTSV
jgi:lipoate-protein ligase B